MPAACRISGPWAESGEPPFLRFDKSPALSRTPWVLPAAPQSSACTSSVFLRGAAFGGSQPTAVKRERGPPMWEDGADRGLAAETGGVRLSW